MAGIIYREARLSDLPRIVQMKMAMFEESGYAGMLAINAQEMVLEDYYRLYEAKEAQHFVANVDKKIISCVGAFLKADLPYRYFKHSTYGFIGDVYTEPEQRGLRVSTELNKIALAWLREKGVSMVRLLATDAGRPIYENLGFVPTDEMVLEFKT